MLMSAAPEVRRRWRPAVLLGAVGALASMAVMPYAMALSPALFARMPLPLPVFLIVQCVQTIVLLALLSWAGFRLADAVGLKAPVLHAATGQVALRSLTQRSLGMAVVAGGLVGLALLVLGKVSEPLIPATISSAAPDIALWKRLLASFYGGIAEELMCRLFLMSLLVWLANRFLAPTRAIADARDVDWHHRRRPRIRRAAPSGRCGIVPADAYGRRPDHRHEYRRRGRLRVAVLATRARTRDGGAFFCRYRAPWDWRQLKPSCTLGCQD